MIIYLGIKNEDLQVVSPILLEERIGILMQTHREGRNFVVLQRSTAAWCIKNLRLSPIDAATLRSIELASTQTGRLVHDAKYYIALTLPGNSFKRAAKKIIELPLDFDDFISIVLPPLVILEDAVSDGRIIESAIKNAPRGLPALHHVGESSVHGGGERIFQIANRKIDDKRIIWIIIDTDRKSPVSKSEKEERLEIFLENSGYPAAFYYVLPCAEIENFVDLEVWWEVDAIRNHPTSGVLHKIRDEEIRNGVDVRDRFELFFDMKEGLDNKKIETERTVEARDWLRNKVMLAGLDPDNFVLKGFGKRIMKNFLEAQELPERLDKVFRNEKWRDVFGEFIADASWIFLCPLRSRT